MDPANHVLPAGFGRQFHQRDPIAGNQRLTFGILFRTFLPDRIEIAGFDIFEKAVVISLEAFYLGEDIHQEAYGGVLVNPFRTDKRDPAKDRKYHEKNSSLVLLV